MEIKNEEKRKRTARESEMFIAESKENKKGKREKVVHVSNFLCSGLTVSSFTVYYSDI